MDVWGERGVKQEGPSWWMLMARRLRLVGVENMPINSREGIPILLPVQTQADNDDKVEQ